MTSPVVRSLNNSWTKIKEGLPVILLCLTLFGALSLSAGRAEVGKIVKTVLENHEEDSRPHESISTLQTNQALILQQLTNLNVQLNRNYKEDEEEERQMVAIQVKQEVMDQKLDTLLQHKGVK